MISSSSAPVLSGLNCKGVSTAAALPASATSAGDFYVISVGGTAYTITWTIGDWAIWNGSAWTQFPGGAWPVARGGTGGTTAAEARTSLDIPSNAELLARQWSAFGHVKFDGAASAPNRGSAFVPGLNIGSGELTMACKFRVPETDPTANCSVAGIGLSSSVIASASSVYWQLDTAGDLSLVKRSAANGFQAVWVFADFVSAYAGQEVQLTTTRNASGWITYINKTVLVANDSDYATETISGQNVLVGAGITAPFQSHIISFEIFNVALTAAEVSELVDFGVLSKFRHWPQIAHFSCNAIANIERNSTFAVADGANTDWARLGSSTVTVTSGKLAIALSGTTGETVSLANTHLAQLKAGQLYKVSFTVSGGSFAGGGATLKWGTSTSDTSGEAIGSVSADGNYNFEFTPAKGIGYLIFNAAVGAQTFSVDDFVITPVLLTNGSFETPGVGGGSSVANNIANGWTTIYTAPSVVTNDTVVTHSGGRSIRMDIGAGGESAQIFPSTSTLVVGRKYRLSAWVRHNKGSALTGFQYSFGGSTSTVATTDAFGNSISIPDSTWTKVTVDGVALGPTPTITRVSGQLVSKSYWIDDVELIPLGCSVSLSSWGLDPETTLWRNQAGSGDATLSGLTMDSASGRYPNIVVGPGRGWSEEGQLTQISRERRALVGGGVYLDGNASQRITSSPTTAQDVSTNTLWLQVSVLVPASNPSSSQGGLFLVSSSATTYAANSFQAYITTDGTLSIELNGSSTSNQRIASIANFVQNFGGKVATVVVCRTSMGLLVWINGVLQAYVETIAGTPPTWSGSITSTYFHAGLRSSGVRWVGDMLLFRVGRGTLTQALVDQLTSTGLSAASGSPLYKHGLFSSSTDGCVIDWDLAAGNGYFFPSRSGTTAATTFNGYAYLTSHSHINQQRRWQIRFRTATSSAVQVPTDVSGAAAIPTNFWIDNVTATTTGTPTVDLGTSSGGEQIIKDWTLAASKNTAVADGASGAALVARFSSNGQLWVKSSTSDAVDWTISGVIVD